MVARFLVHVLPALLPFALYGLYLWHVKRAGRDGPETTPWFWLSAAGLVLMIASFLVYGLFFEEEIGQYVPARLEDGRVVPGQVMPKAGAK